MSVSHRLLYYFRPHIKRISAGVLLTVLMGMCDLLFAPCFRILVNGLTDLNANIQKGFGLTAFISEKVTIGSKSITFFEYNIDGFGTAIRFLVFLGIGVIILILFKSVFIYGKEYIMASVVQKVLRTLRTEIYSHLLSLSMKFYDRGKTGSLMSRITNDVGNIEYSFLAGVDIVRAAVYTCLFLSYMFFRQWQLTLVTLIMFPLAGITIRYFGNRFRVISRRITNHLAEINAYLMETLSAIKIIKSYTREDYERKRFSQKMGDHYAFNMRSSRIIAAWKPVNEMLSQGGMLVVVLFSGYKMITGSMNIGDLTEFIILLTMVYKPLKTVGTTGSVIQKALASSENIFKILDAVPESMKEENDKVVLEKMKGDVVFKNVYFSYKENNFVLKGIDFHVNPGETVALVGSSGVGKSTIINLLLRFYTVDSGSILIDGCSVDKISLQSLRSQISIVPQETFLFSGTVIENIRYGRLDSTDKEVEEAARMANAHQFIMEMPQGYQTEVGERGMQLSGGQRQRISIARAILADPRILLLDEATSSLDSESEQLIQEATEKLMKNRTSFVIAHRLSTVQNADCIFVIDNGKIEEMGTHKQLIKKDGLYKKLYTMQFNP